MTRSRMLLRFAGCYVLLTVLLAVVLAVFDIPSNSGAHAGVLIGATWFACDAFFKSHQRVFTTAEKRSALWGMVAVDVGLQLLMGLLVLPSWKPEVLLTMAGLFLLVTVLHAGAIYLGIFVASRNFNKRLAAQA